ncbi:radical SAM protein [Patescibacteria group bacterium]|nr:radical SAM protein [Patescibacteria group bacterium]
MATLGYIQITRKCNQKCRFCSNPPNRNTLSFEQGKKDIDKYIKQGYDGVILTGGEPTLSSHLAKFLSYCSQKEFQARIITNGQKTANLQYLKKLKEAGLYHLHLSIYSIKPEIQAFLTQKKSSLKNIIETLKNLKKLGGINVDINTVINKYNAGHLKDNVILIVKRFPFIHHFVWNNIDPLMNRASKNIDTIPKLNDFELELHKAMEFLEKNRRSFRVERVPLCYMSGFEHCSTETRKIVKQEERSVRFLDSKGYVRQTEWKYGKAKCCKNCFLNDICAGLYQMDTYYSSKELYPVFVSREEIIKKILL